MLQSRWETLQQLSEKMLEMAHCADWEHLTELESQRNPLIREYFSAATAQLESETLTRQLNWVQAVERELLDLCILEKNTLSSELLGLQKGKTAGNAYLSNAS